MQGVWRATVPKRRTAFCGGGVLKYHKVKAGRRTRLFYQSANDSVQRRESLSFRCNALAGSPRSNRNSFSRLLRATGASFLNASHAESQASIVSLVSMWLSTLARTPTSITLVRTFLMRFSRSTNFLGEVNSVLIEVSIQLDKLIHS